MTASADVASARPLALRLGLLGLCLGAVWVLWPLWPPLLLGAWCAALSRPLLLRLAAVLRGRHRAATALTVIVLVLLLIPVGVLGMSLSAAAVDLGRRIAASPGGTSALRLLVSDSDDGALSLRRVSLDHLIQVAQLHGEQAWRAARIVAGATARGILFLFLFLLTTYAILADGPRAYAYLERHAPVEPRHLRRLAQALLDTGRGLFVGVLLTVLTQGLLATLTYLLLGIPRALVLGLLTALAAVIPGIGTALIWVPTAAGLALAGRPGAAVALAVIGLLVISTIDNVLRPLYASYARLNLPPAVAILAAFGGLLACGVWGLILGPTIVRLAREGLEIAREEGMVGGTRAVPRPPSDAGPG